MLKIAVVEDQQEVRDELCRFIRQYAAENSLQVEVLPVEDGAVIAEHYEPGYDIIFMDVEMPGLDGFGAAEKIRAVDADAVLVFVTNMAQYAIKGYEVDALDYVLKPVNYYQFCTKLSRAVQRVQRRRGGQVVLQLAGGGMQVLSTGDIYYLETHDRLLWYHTTKGEFSVRASLASAEKQLAQYHFSRCNQCYLVNLRHVTGVQNDFVQIGQEQLEITRWRLMSGVRCSGPAGNAADQCPLYLAGPDGLLAAAETTGKLPPAVSFGFCGHGTLCAGHYLGQQRAHLGPDAAGDLWWVLFVGEHFYKIVYPAGRRCQRLLQRLDRAYVGIYL